MGNWIFFDLGWTLIDETDAHLERFGRLRPLGPPYSEVRDAEYLELCVAHSTHFAPSPFLATLRTLDPAGWESAKRHATYSHASERLYPGVRELLSRLGESFRLGVIAVTASTTISGLPTPTGGGPFGSFKASREGRPRVVRRSVRMRRSPRLAICPVR